MAWVSLTMPVTFDAAEKLPMRSGRLAVALELAREVGLVDVAVGVLADVDDLGDRLAPRQLVGVVLERADEHDRALARAGCGRSGGSASSSRAGMRRPRMPTSLSIAAVEPEPQKMTALRRRRRARRG